MGKDIEPTVTEMAAGDLTVSKLLDIVRAGGTIRLAEDDAEQTHWAMLEQTAAATTAEEILGGTGDVLKHGDLEGVPFQIVSVEFRNSDEKYLKEAGGFGIFAVVHLISFGKPEVLVSGSEDVLVKCLRLKEANVLPTWATLSSSTTKGGFTVWNLSPVDAPAV